MTEVWIYHDGLGRYSLVPETAVGVHAMSGWIQKDPPPESDEVGEDEQLATEIEATQPTQEGDEE